jgi:DNA-binding YbaB/EbfC family protein
MIKDFSKLMQQAQKMQQELKKSQAQLANLEVTGESGAGLVKIVMTGKYDAKQVTIDPSVLTEDKGFLQDLVAAAINDAVRKVEQANKQQMSSVTKGLELPGGMKLPL